MAKQSEVGNTVYKVVEVIGTSTQCWEDAAKNAVETAGRQGARLYLLRAARHLAQILAEDADPYAARALLQPVVEDFPEHRDGQDFREASELLASLQ